MRTRGIVWSLAFVAVIVLLCGNPSDAIVDTRQPVVDGHVQDANKDGLPDLALDNSIVQLLDVPSFEVRGIIEFSLSGISQPVSSAEVVLPVFASEGPFPFTVDVFGYAGDGALTVSDWAPGSL